MILKRFIKTRKFLLNSPLKNIERKYEKILKIMEKHNKVEKRDSLNSLRLPKLTRFALNKQVKIIFKYAYALGPFYYTRRYNFIL